MCFFHETFCFSCVTFFLPYIRSQTRQPLDATIHQCSRASLRIPSWLSFTKLPPFSGLHDKFSTLLRSLFWNAHSRSLGFVPSFQKLIFRIPCIVRIIFFLFFTSEVWHKKSNVRPAALKTLRGREHTSQHFSKDIMQILHWYSFPKCFLFWVARLFGLTDESINALRVLLLAVRPLRSYDFYCSVFPNL